MSYGIRGHSLLTQCHTSQHYVNPVGRKKWPMLSFLNYVLEFVSTQKEHITHSKHCSQRHLNTATALSNTYSLLFLSWKLRLFFSVKVEAWSLTKAAYTVRKLFEGPALCDFSQWPWVRRKCSSDALQTERTSSGHNLKGTLFFSKMKCSFPPPWHLARYFHQNEIEVRRGQINIQTMEGWGGEGSRNGKGWTK